MRKNIMSKYVTRAIKIELYDIENLLSEVAFEEFLNLVSYLHSNTEYLMDIDIKEISPMVLEITGDVSEARKYEEYV